jgi:hypothetical protein
MADQALSLANQATISYVSTQDDQGLNHNETETVDRIGGTCWHVGRSFTRSKRSNNLFAAVKTQ